MYASEDITFNSNDETLFGTLYKPANVATCPVIVVLHAANLGERESDFYDHLKETLPSCGIGVFIYDRRGSGESSGDFDTCSFNDLANDALAAIYMLREKNEIQRVGLYGISQGGWIASLVTSMFDEVAFLIMVSTPAVSPAKQMLYATRVSLQEAGFSKGIMEEATRLRKKVDAYYRGKLERDHVQSLLQKELSKEWYPYAYLPQKGLLPEDKKKSKWYYELDYNPITCFKTIKVPTLFIFGEKDVYVPVHLSIEIFKETAKNGDVTFLKYNNVDHFMNMTDNKGRGISKEYKHNLTRWLGRFNDN